MPQQPYSPDLAPCDFFLFPKLKRPMKVDKNGIEGGEQDHEKLFFEVLRGLEKNVSTII